MEDKDAELLRNQRRRRKRIGRIKSAVMMTIYGWIILSVVLILLLFVRTTSLERKFDLLIENRAAGTEVPEDTGETSEGTRMPAETYAAAPASGIADADNLAVEGDIHKIYLTFDGGPSENTGEILDILAAHDVKATFFVVGKEDEESQEIYRRIVAEGHTLGMRSYSNKYSVIYQSEEAFASDYRKLRDYLYQVTGTESLYYRFPGGSSNQISNVPMRELIGFLNERGIIYYDWNVSAGDAASTAYTSDEIVANVTGDVVKYKTSVVLLQDAVDKSATVEALGSLIEALRGMDAEILPIDEDTQAIQYVKADGI